MRSECICRIAGRISNRTIGTLGVGTISSFPITTSVVMWYVLFIPAPGVCTCHRVQYTTTNTLREHLGLGRHDRGIRKHSRKIVTPVIPGIVVPTIDPSPSLIYTPSFVCSINTHNHFSPHPLDILATISYHSHNYPDLNQVSRRRKPKSRFNDGPKSSAPNR